MRSILALALSFLFLSAPAEASEATHILKKLAWLPVYVVFAHPISILTWYNCADEHKVLVDIDELRDDVSEADLLQRIEDHEKRVNGDSTSDDDSTF